MTERTCHPLHAEDAVIAVPAERYIKCLEAEHAWRDKRDRERAKRKRGPSAFTQADVTRAVKGATAGGAEVRKVEVSREKITVEIGEAEDGEPRDASIVAMDRIAALRRVK